MQLFGSKPRKPTAPSGGSSTGSASGGAAPVPSQTSAAPSPPSRPGASTGASAPQAPQGTGTTEQQAAAVRRMSGTISETHDLAGRAVVMLADLTSPREGQGEDRLQELVDAVGLVLGEVRALREEVAALRASLPVRRVPGVSM